MKPTTATTTTPAPRPPALRRLRTVDLHTRQWWDKVNGNTYFAARVVLNFGMPDAFTLTLPFQYGYGSQSEWEAAARLLDLYPRSPEARARAADPRRHAKPLWQFCRDRGIILRTSKDYAKQREVKAFGRGD